VIYRQGQLHNLLAPMQNENVESLTQKAGKMPLNVIKHEIFSFLQVSHSTCHGAFICYLMVHSLSEDTRWVNANSYRHGEPHP
jgi:hypothetical protein